MARKQVAQLKSETSRVMRISGENFEQFTQLKTQFTRKRKLKRSTYDGFMAELLRVADLLLSGHEIYVTNHQAFIDLAQARGESVRESVQKKLPYDPPLVCLVIGQDDWEKQK